MPPVRYHAMAVVGVEHKVVEERSKANVIWRKQLSCIGLVHRRNIVRSKTV